MVPHAVDGPWTRGTEDVEVELETKSEEEEGERERDALHTSIRVSSSIPPAYAISSRPHGLTVIFGATCVVAVNMINRGERGHTYQQAVLVLSRATGVRMVPVYV